jgi:hypothetical protein
VAARAQAAEQVNTKAEKARLAALYRSSSLLGTCRTKMAKYNTAAERKLAATEAEVKDEVAAARQRAAQVIAGAIELHEQRARGADAGLAFNKGAAPSSGVGPLENISGAEETFLIRIHHAMQHIACLETRITLLD